MTKESQLRFIAVVGYVAAGVGIIGLILAPSAAFVWAFLIVFGLVKLPHDVWNLWKRHRNRDQKGAQD